METVNLKDITSAAQVTLEDKVLLALADGKTRLANLEQLRALVGASPPSSGQAISDVLDAFLGNTTWRASGAPQTAAEIRDSLSSLSGQTRLAATAIRDLQAGRPVIYRAATEVSSAVTGQFFEHVEDLELNVPAGNYEVRSNLILFGSSSNLVLEYRLAVEGQGFGGGYSSENSGILNLSFSDSGGEVYQTTEAPSRHMVSLRGNLQVFGPISQVRVEAAMQLPSPQAVDDAVTILPGSFIELTLNTTTL
jgi:hypothetical protein